MGIEADDLVQQIRSEAYAQLERPHDGSAAFPNGSGDLESLRAALAAARRAQDQLPPVTTYRRGVIARLELWVKRRLKSATRWFTWEQTNFNAATVSSIESTVTTLAHLERGLSELRSSVQVREGFPERDRSIAAVEARLAALESSVQSLLTAIQSERAEQIRRIDLLIEEQRVCFRQLALEISETAIVADRAKRNLEMQIAELSRRLDETSIQKAASKGR